MLLQEKLDQEVEHTFVEEQIAKAALLPLGWRAEGKAERPVLIEAVFLQTKLVTAKRQLPLA
jgi:hypothetical protein